jgi:hypothetical protein
MEASMRLRTPCFLGIAGLLACPTGSAGDTLKIENIAGGDTVVVVMDSRISDANGWWCRNDEVRQIQPSAGDPTTAELALNDVPAANGCNSEIVVFAEQNAMALSFAAWTDSSNDVHTITLKPIIDVPVSVWIANAASVARAPNDMAKATSIYRKNKVGVRFVPTYHNVSSDAKAVATIGKSCDSIGWIRKSAWYTPHTLNVYYVERIVLPPELGSGPAAGLTCDRFGDGDIKGDANIIFIGPDPDDATVAHEIGHAFGLRPGNLNGKPAGGHTNGLKGLPSNNVMCAFGCSRPREHFSLGQAFRMNTQADEWGGTRLIANGLRPGPGRTCPPLATSDICPPLSLDWIRP